MASDIKFARERILKRIIEKSPDDDKSNKSRRKSKKTAKSPTKAALNDSQITG